jgi:PAS domain S-box-containing protein
MTTSSRPGLRAEAEARFARDRPPVLPGEPASPLLHELQVHQIELEMQNEELRQAQVSLAASRDLYLDLYDFAPVGYLTVTNAGVIDEANLTAASLLGVDRARLRGSRFAGHVVPESLGNWGRIRSDVRADDEPHSCDLALLRGTSVFSGQVSCRRAGGVGGAGAVRVVLTDISRRKRAEEALQESEGRFRLLANVTAIGIFQTGAQGQILFVNPTYLALTGLSEAEAHGPDGRMAIHPDDRERVVGQWEEAVGAGSPFTVEYRHQFRDGKVNWVRLFGRPFLDGAGAVAGYVGALVDITEPRALQAQLALASRLAAMGTLVSGVAHEINNPLAAEMAGQGLALEVVREVRARLDAGVPLDRKAEASLLGGAVEALEDAQGSGQRIARIVKDLSMFGRPDSRRERVRMIDVVNGALRWLPAAVARTATILVQDGGAPDVAVASGQIEQVVVNLVTNAARAAPEGQRDTIIVRIGPGEPGTARLEVVDHGTGITPAVLDRVFEPFFTTHAVGPGKGMGLGLAISHAIVTEHGGTITARSVVGEGATFRVELPVA